MRCSLYISFCVFVCWQVGLDAFNAFIRFLYIGYVEQAAKWNPTTISSFIALGQWYKLRSADSTGEAIMDIYEYDAPASGEF